MKYEDKVFFFGKYCITIINGPLGINESMYQDPTQDPTTGSLDVRINRTDCEPLTREEVIHVYRNLAAEGLVPPQLATGQDFDDTDESSEF